MTSPPSDDRRVDELRQRLRSLGYLDAGVDRFVLGPARATRRPAAIAFLASLRVGALAAILLGPAAALGLSARLPGLVTGPRDALVVAIYLGAFFGAVMTVSAFVVSLLVPWVARHTTGGFARRGTWLSRAAGGLVAVLCLIYLTLWWQTVIAGLGWSAPVWTLSALALAAAMSLLLGHAVAVASSAVLLATAGAAGDTERRQSSWRTTIAAGALAFGAAALLLTWSADSTRAAAPVRDALTVVPAGLRVRVIAIDGFDARIFDEMSAGGRLPAITAAFQGARIRLEQGANDGADPARVWTTVATGQPPDVHGVQGLETRRVAGVQGSMPIVEPSPLGRAMRGATDLVRLTRPAIASGTERRAKTFWEVAAAAGLRTVVVNWWATWPAPPDAGIVLSDRATLRLERGGSLDAEIAPDTLYEPLRQRWPAIKSLATVEATKALELPPDDSTRAILQRSAELDAMQLALLAGSTTPDTDLSVVYLPGLDIAQHALLGPTRTPAGDDRAGLSASIVAARLDALKAYYAALDRLLAPVLTPSPDELVLVVTEPGRVGGDGGARLWANGAAVRSSEHITSASTAVAPTVLYSLGVPIGRDLPSAPLLEVFEPRFSARYPVRHVATYGRPSGTPAARTGQPLDQEMIDRLRSLGYVR
jgi:hypothetical protein